MLEHFEFVIGGYFNGYHKYEISRQEDGTYQGVYTPSFEGRYGEPQKHIFTVSARKTKKVDEFLEVELHDWKKYYDSCILDGTQWHLDYNGKHHGGSNAFPENFDYVLKFLVKNLKLKKVKTLIGIGASFAER